MRAIGAALGNRTIEERINLMKGGMLDLSNLNLSILDSIDLGPAAKDFEFDRLITKLNEEPRGNIKSIDLTSTSISLERFALLAKALLSNSTLQALNLTGVKINKEIDLEGTKALADVLQGNAALEEFNFYDIGVNKDEAEVIFEKLKQLAILPNIKEITLSKQQVEQIGELKLMVLLSAVSEINSQTKLKTFNVLDVNGNKKHNIVALKAEIERFDQVFSKVLRGIENSAIVFIKPDLLESVEGKLTVDHLKSLVLGGKISPSPVSNSDINKMKEVYGYNESDGSIGLNKDLISGIVLELEKIKDELYEDQKSEFLKREFESRAKIDKKQATLFERTNEEKVRVFQQTSEQAKNNLRDKFRKLLGESESSSLPQIGSRLNPNLSGQLPSSSPLAPRGSNIEFPSLQNQSIMNTKSNL